MLLLVGATLSSTAAVPTASAAPVAGTLPATWQKGMNLTSWTPDGYSSSTARDALHALAAVGTDRIVLTPTSYMDTATSNDIAPDPERTPTDSSIRTIAAEARSKGFAVVIKPHVDVRDGTFRGQISPGNRVAWFASYRAMIARYAVLATAVKADMLVVGTELTSMSTDTDGFESVIAVARRRFRGALTYAANWTAEAQAVRFWGHLDAIGVDAYMPLADAGARPTVAHLIQAWQPQIASLAAVHAQTGKPVLFTELGYRSTVNAASDPANGQGRTDPGVQAVAYRAALQAWSGVPWFQGIWWWNQEAEPTGEDASTTYTVQGKPAMAVLRAAQGRQVAADGAPDVPMPGPGALPFALAMCVGLVCFVLSRRARHVPGAHKTLGSASL